MIAIETTYLPSTNHRSSRIKVKTCNGMSLIVPFDASSEHPYFLAVQKFVEHFDLDWNIYDMVYGSTENGMVFCFKESEIKILNSYDAGKLLQQVPQTSYQKY